VIQFLKNLLPRSLDQLEEEADEKWEQVRELAREKDDKVIGYRGTYVAKGWIGCRKAVKDDIKRADELLGELKEVRTKHE